MDAWKGPHSPSGTRRGQTAATNSGTHCDHFTGTEPEKNIAQTWAPSY